MDVRFGSNLSPNWMLQILVFEYPFLVHILARHRDVKFDKEGANLPAAVNEKIKMSYFDNTEGMSDWPLM